MFELPPTGGVFPSLDFHAVKLLRYVHAGDYLVLACELVYIAFIGYYIVEEAIEIRHNRIAYFGNVWNLLDITVIGVSCVNVGLVVLATWEMEQVLGGLLSRPDEFANFVYLGYWYVSLFIVKLNWQRLCVFKGFSHGQRAGPLPLLHLDQASQVHLLQQDDGAALAHAGKG